MPFDPHSIDETTLAISKMKRVAHNRRTTLNHLRESARIPFAYLHQTLRFFAPPRAQAPRVTPHR